MTTTNLLFVKTKQPLAQSKPEEVKKCLTCNITFEDSKSQKAHFKSEWHLYNIKRKNSQLGPISYDDYVEIKNQLQEMISAKNEKNAGKNSQNNPKTVDFKAKAGADGIKSPEKYQKHMEFDPKRCLFNSVVSKSIEENVKYMETHYTFFLPEKEYIADLEGLLRHIHRKIYEENTCLYCDRLFSDQYATLHHMEAKQHHKINDDKFDQISSYYDFVNSYVNLIMESSSTPKTNTDLTPSNAEDEEEEWEDLFSTTSSPTRVEDLLTTYGIKRAYIMENGNLSLPNGKEAVHRELSYVYKQNLVLRNPFSLKKKEDNFKFKKKSEKRQIILSQKQQQYRVGKRDLNVALKSYKLFVPVRQDLCFG
ncbi:uncharacterized protein TOT_020000088 [Theileria orientalis strain Shintoku]|uniref:C2H2-type domain-containing protein n=1 Tax=Theileria orientalis strain Shintoku TaxID=869250 RepID=J4CCQ8_THEOR|nr:uncharacterized protein TOT_020000088 [Theileria orientalis strain Shintoku]PVC50245.1 hypothetical protein MACL_00002436 [Theileria orientalis]BAM39817.1 uncharacterized protein TOT_020000088 [Theileria orientalis strain Shintoku]|eukprot:XP_009690118.1 uncharacterized protein TOT_020000088 [Theileria orientalis strain Shintoku]